MVIGVHSEMVRHQPSAPDVCYWSKVLLEADDNWIVVTFSQEGAPVEWHMFVPLFAPDLITRSSDLLCLYSDEDMPSFVVSYLTRSHHNQACRVWEIWLSPMFALM